MEDGFRPVAVVHVKIPDGNAPGAEVAPCGQGGDRDLVQVTESHSLAAGRMVPRRPHE
jgi:hypothetical protein